jgi:hypothetical protein
MLGLISVFALAVVCVGVTSPVQADLISGPFTTTTPIADTLTDWAGSLSFPQFNSALGTLTEVDLAFSGDMSTVLTIHNTGDSASSGNAKTEVQMTIQDAGNNLSVPELDFLSPAYAYSLGAGDSISSGTLVKSSSSSNSYTLAAVLSEFTGPGTIVLPASTFTQTDLSNTGGNTSAAQVTDAGLTGTVTYHYNAVPEPSTLALLLIGAVGLLVCPWRRRRA